MSWLWLIIKLNLASISLEYVCVCVCVCVWSWTYYFMLDDNAQYIKNLNQWYEWDYKMNLSTQSLHTQNIIWYLKFQPKLLIRIGGFLILKILKNQEPAVSKKFKESTTLVFILVIDQWYYFLRQKFHQILTWKFWIWPKQWILFHGKKWPKFARYLEKEFLNLPN
jgi:hypothetical protein